MRIPVGAGEACDLLALSPPQKNAKRRFYPRQKRQRHVPQRKSVHEQGDQDDDRDRYAEKEQQ
ncbi:hypothetical protein CUN63_25050 [Pseudomonas sp. ACM7]|nr:hypothetical protein CUN63_25050 [Pseudomonas sp. ACM7]